MKHLLDGVRNSIGTPPQQLGFWTRWRLRKRPPEWMPRKDDLRNVYVEQKHLLDEGEVLWAALVHANGMLFQPGLMDHPAMTIYAPDNSFDKHPSHLRQIAARLFQLKGTTAGGPEAQRWGDMLANESEVDREFGWLVPKSWTEGREVRATQFMVFRKHLPGGFLRSGWFPLLVHDQTAAVMICPKNFWPQELVDLWSNGGSID